MADTDGVATHGTELVTHDGPPRSAPQRARTQRTRQPDRNLNPTVIEAPDGASVHESSRASTHHEHRSANAGINIQRSSGNSSPVHSRRDSTGTAMSMNIADCQRSHARDLMEVAGANSLDSRSTRRMNSTASLRHHDPAHLTEHPLLRGIRSSTAPFLATNLTPEEPEQEAVFIMAASELFAALNWTAGHLLTKSMVLEFLREYAAGNVLEVIWEARKVGTFSTDMIERLRTILAQFEPPKGVTAEETMEALTAFSKHKLREMSKQFEPPRDVTAKETVEASKTLAKHLWKQLRK